MISSKELENGTILTWSTLGYDIKCDQTGDTFESALDLKEYNFTYTEVIPENTEGNE